MRRVTSAILVALTVLVVGCSDADDDGTTSDATPEPTEETETTE